MKSEALKMECNGELLDLARRLVTAIENNNTSVTISYIDELARVRESDLFQELGKLTRQLHESLGSFQLDTKIAAMAEKEIPDAKARLNHVITMTGEAAHRTMNAVDAALPDCEILQSHAETINREWIKFRTRELSVEDFRKMSKQLDGFFFQVDKNTKSIHKNLTDIVLAQDYQDLTGQIISRVIHLVQEVENSLVALIRFSGKPVSEDVPVNGKYTDLSGHGPKIPGVDHGSSVNGQDEVDSLLSSLGF